jgi:hypothetical protein
VLICWVDAVAVEAAKKTKCVGEKKRKARSAKKGDKSNSKSLNRRNLRLATDKPKAQQLIPHPEGLDTFNPSSCARDFTAQLHHSYSRLSLQPPMTRSSYPLTTRHNRHHCPPPTITDLPLLNAYKQKSPFPTAKRPPPSPPSALLSHTPQPPHLPLPSRSAVG